MLKVDNEKMLIAVTRGDTATIVFSAKDEDGQTYTASSGDKLKFAVAKKVGATPIFQVETIYDDSPSTFWDITIQPSKTADMKFGDYAFDVQLTHGGEVDTIIGKTDTVSPTFRVWGEVATE